MSDPLADPRLIEAESLVFDAEAEERLGGRRVAAVRYREAAVLYEAVAQESDLSLVRVRAALLESAAEAIRRAARCEGET